MAGAKIKGLTIELGADTTKFKQALGAIDKDLKTTQSNLKDINKLLKLDPGNTQLLTQKQKNLESAIGLTKKRLEELKDAQSKVKEGSAEWDAIQREIIETDNKLKDLQKQYKDFGSVASQQIKAVGESLKTAGGKVTEFGQKLTPVSGAATAFGSALLKIGYDAVTASDDLNTLAKQTGFTTEQIQKMQYASDRIDVSFDDISGALKKLKTKIDPTNETLKKLGIRTTYVNGETRGATEVFYEALTVLSRIENETERDQMAMELFGKSADSLAGIIDDGGAALKMYGDEAESLGLILDQDTLDALNATNDEIDKIKAQIKATMAVVGSQVVPVVAPLITKIGELITSVAQKLTELNPETMETILAITGIVAALAPVIMIGGKLITGLGSIITAVGSVVGILGGPLTIAIAAIVAIGIVLYKNWDTIKEKAVELAQRVKNSWENLKTAVSTAIDSVKSKIDTLKQTFETLKEKVVGVWDTIKGVLTGQISLPHIPLPHFVISPPGWQFSDLLKGKIPSLGIDWYKKAYDNPVMFTSPTVMATPSGYKGFGDGDGAEIVMGLNKLRELVGGKTSEPITITTQVVLDGRVVGESVTKYQRNLARARG